MAQSQNLDIISNNLSNANTAGFKKDSPTFKEYLTAVEKPPSPDVDIPRTIFKDSDFYHFDGREHAMVNLDRIHADHTAGTFRMTGAPLDMALEGPGFIAVQGPQGLLFSRAGELKINSKGLVTTTDGFPVLALGAEAEAALTAAKEATAQALQAQQAQLSAGAAAQNTAAVPGQPATPAPTPPVNRAVASINPFVPQSQAVPGKEPALKPLNISEGFSTGQKIIVAHDGAVYFGDQQVGTLAIAEFVDPKLLQKMGSSTFSNPNTANVPRLATETRVHQGFIEQSNVNPVQEVLEMLKANRLFESNMKAIRTYNDISAKEANEVGKL